jgi:hypothetical protein
MKTAQNFKEAQEYHSEVTLVMIRPLRVYYFYIVDPNLSSCEITADQMIFHSEFRYLFTTKTPLPRLSVVYPEK